MFINLVLTKRLKKDSLPFDELKVHMHLKICKFNIFVNIIMSQIEWIQLNIAQKMKFSIKDFFTFTAQMLNGKLHFLCSEMNGEP